MTPTEEKIGIISTYGMFLSKPHEGHDALLLLYNASGRLCFRSYATTQEGAVKEMHFNLQRKILTEVIKIVNERS